MLLSKLEATMKAKTITPEALAEKSKGEFSNMTIRRALKGRGVKLITAKSIARALRVALNDLV